MWKLNIRFHFFFFSEETDYWLQITFHYWYRNFLKPFAELLQDVSLFLWQLSFFCYAHTHHFVIDDLFCPNLLLAIEKCRKNEKTEELSGANLENATFANLFSSPVFKYYTNVAFTSFALNLLLSIYILATYLLRANFICANTFFRSVLKQQL